MKKIVVSAEFYKSHVEAYTRKDGVVVQAHETHRAAAERLAEKIRKHGPEYEPHVEVASGGSAYVTVKKHAMTASGKRHAKKSPTQIDYKARFADHGSYWGSTISVDPVTQNSEDDAMAMFEHATNPKQPPRIKSFKRSRIDPRDRTQFVSTVSYNENVHKNGGKDYWREGGREQAKDLTKSLPIQQATPTPIRLFLKSSPAQ